MVNIPPIDESIADFDTRSILDYVRKTVGFVPPSFLTMAHSPCVLRAFLMSNQVLSGGILSNTTRVKIALAVSERNNSNYCIAMNTLLAEEIGVTSDEIRLARRGHANDRKTDTLLQLAMRLANGPIEMSGSSYASISESGCSHGEICELIANVALNIFANSFNVLANIDSEFTLQPETDPI